MKTKGHIKRNVALNYKCVTFSEFSYICTTLTNGH